MTDDAPAPAFETIIIEKSTWVRARAAGIHYSLVRVGSKVDKGMTIGLITGPFGDFEVPVKSPLNGYIIALNNHPVVNRGDALFHIGKEAGL